MKKALFFSAVSTLALVSSVSNAKSASGLYAGVQVGLLSAGHAGNARIYDIQTDPAPNTFTQSLSYSNNNLVGGAFVGWQKSTAKGFYGVEGFANYANADVKTESKDLTDNYVFYLGSFATKFSKKGSLGLTAKTGWDLPRNKGTFYVSASFLASKFQFSYISDDSVNFGTEDGKGKQSKTLWAVAPGVGFQYDLNEKLSLRVDYQYRFYQKFKLKPGNDLKKDNGVKGSLRMEDQTVMAGLVYKFSK